MGIKKDYWLIDGHFLIWGIIQLLTMAHGKPCTINKGGALSRNQTYSKIIKIVQCLDGSESLLIPLKMPTSPTAIGTQSSLAVIFNSSATVSSTAPPLSSCSDIRRWTAEWSSTALRHGNAMRKTTWHGIPVSWKACFILLEASSRAPNNSGFVHMQKDLDIKEKAAIVHP